MGLLQPASSKTIEPAIKDAVLRSSTGCRQNSHFRISVAEMAREAQISESHYFKVFHEIWAISRRLHGAP